MTFGTPALNTKWFFALLAMVACETTAITNRQALHLLPDSQMNQMGDQEYEKIKQTSKIERDTTMRNEVFEIGKRIAAASGANFKWEFELIDEDKTVNAFCLPGGKIAVYTGILKVAENNAALAAVLGHEVAHAVLKHGNERVSQTLIAQGGLTAATIALSNAKYRDVIVGLMGVGAQYGVMLPFSRSHESEADYVGLLYMAKAGYDPREAPKLWTRMAKAGGGGGIELLSTHPDPARRSKVLEGQIADVMDEYNQSDRVGTQKLTIK